MEPFKSQTRAQVIYILIISWLLHQKQGALNLGGEAFCILDAQIIIYRLWNFQWTRVTKRYTTTNRIERKMLLCKSKIQFSRAREEISSLHPAAHKSRRRFPAEYRSSEGVAYIIYTCIRARARVHLARKVLWRALSGSLSLSISCLFDSEPWKLYSSEVFSTPPPPFGVKTYYYYMARCCMRFVKPYLSRCAVGAIF